LLCNKVQQFQLRFNYLKSTDLLINLLTRRILLKKRKVKPKVSKSSLLTLSNLKIFKAGNITKSQLHTKLKKKNTSIRKLNQHIRTVSYFFLKRQHKISPKDKLREKLNTSTKQIKKHVDFMLNLIE